VSIDHAKKLDPLTRIEEPPGDLDDD